MHTIDGGSTFEMAKEHLNLKKAVGCDKISQRDLRLSSPVMLIH